MKLYYKAFYETMKIIDHITLANEPSKFIKSKGSGNTLSKSKRKELRKKRKK